MKINNGTAQLNFITFIYTFIREKVGGGIKESGNLPPMKKNSSQFS